MESVHPVKEEVLDLAVRLNISPAAVVETCEQLAAGSSRARGSSTSVLLTTSHHKLHQQLPKVKKRRPEASTLG